MLTCFKYNQFILFLNYFCSPAIRKSKLDIQSGQNKMDNKSDDQIIFMQAPININKQIPDELKQDCDELNKKLNKLHYIV